VYVAQAVIAAIHDIGGRFLKEEIDGSWTEIAHPRSIEKTCQALREKEKPNPQFEGFTGSADGPPPQKKHKSSSRGNGQLNSDDDSATGSTTASEADSDDDNNSDSDNSSDDSSLETETEDEDNDTRLAGAAAAKIPAWDHQEMLRSLENFKKSYGHAAVPSGWAKDEDLADWATHQRQLYRETRDNYREATADENKLFKELNAFVFVWDYDMWHWDTKYRALAAWYADLVAQEKAGEISKDTTDGVAPSKDLIEWLQDQRRQYRDGQWQVPTDRVEKLRQLGVPF
jgi:hypothetical protein